MSDWITFPGDKKGRLSWAYDSSFAARWQTLLAQAHGNKSERPRCNCWTQGAPLGLVVRSITRPGESTRRYYLARMPGDGTLHKASCPFREKDSRRSGRSGYQQGVIQELVDGGVRVSLKTGLMIQNIDREPTDRRTPATGREGRPLQSKMSLLGLLHLLWEEAGLTDWSPAARRQRTWWPGIRSALHTAADKIAVGTNKLADHLAMFGYNDRNGPAYFEATARHCGNTRRILLLGVLNHLAVYLPAQKVEGAGQAKPRLRIGFDGGRPFKLHVFGTEALAEKLAVSFPWAWGELQRPWSERKISIVGLVSAEIRSMQKADGLIWTAWANDIALMETGKSLVPVASSHELRVLEALEAAQRHFRKPLRFDAHRDEVLPDFELLDTRVTRGLPMEVFGRTDESYTARRAEKERYYMDVFGTGGWWAWDATRDEDWPAFPAAVQPVKQDPEA